ncbi:MAG TPA: ABC transporter permease, partial [Magnetococcales bacterium]|nr:ABC transporter permease [Magnetococcales bacterium]
MTTESHPVQRRDPGQKKGLPPANRNRPVNARRGRPGQPKILDHATSYTHNFHLRSLFRAWRRFRGGSLSHWTTTVIIALSLTIHGCFVLLLANADSAIEKWKGDNLVTVFLKKETTVSQLSQVRDQLLGKAEIKNLNVVSPNDAMERMKTMLGPESGLLNDLNDNPLSYSLEFHVLGNDPNHTSFLAREIGSWPDVEAVSYDQEWARKLSAAVQFIRFTGMSLLLLLLTAVALIISNTIKLTIVARRDEIEVMRFMGATDMFIKAPFIYEGFIQGLLGALGAIGMIFTLYHGAARVTSELTHTFGFHMALSFLSFPQLSFLLILG